MLLFFISLHYQPYKLNGYYYEPRNQSIDAQYDGYYQFQGSSNVFQFRKQFQNNASFQISLKDSHIINKVIGKQINHSQSYEIEGNYQISNGNFTTDQFVYQNGHGWYFPDVMLGVVQFKKYKLFQNKKQLITMEEALNLVMQENFPHTTLKLNESLIEQFNNNKTKVHIKKCNSYLYFALNEICLNDKQTLVLQNMYKKDHLEDIQIQQVFKKINSSCLLSYQMTAQIFSEECAFKMKTNGNLPFNFENQQHCQNFLFFIFILSILSFYYSLKFIANFNFEQNTETTYIIVVMWMSANYLFIVFCLIQIGFIGAKKYLIILIVLLQLPSLAVSEILVFYKLYTIIRHIFNNNENQLIISALLTMTSVFPGLLIIVIGQFKDYITVITVCVVVLYSWIIVYVLLLLIIPQLMNPLKLRPSAIFFDYLAKSVLMIYVMTYKENYLFFETNVNMIYPLLAPFIFIAIYCIQYKKGPKLGFTFKSNQNKLYDYHHKLISEITIKQYNNDILHTDSDSQNIVVPFKNKKLGCCDNPLHKHSSSFTQDKNTNSQNFRQIKVQYSNVSKKLCFAIINQKFMIEGVQCGICLDSIQLNDYLAIWDKYDVKQNKIQKFSLKSLFSKQKNQKHTSDQNIDLLENQQQILFITPCKHYFHKKCLNTWMIDNSTCPVDRKQLKPTKEI